MEKLEKEKLKWDIVAVKIGIISTAVLILSSLFTLSTNMLVSAKEHMINSKIKIESCQPSTEIHLGEELCKYAITIEPPYEMGRIGVQAYITVTYDGNKQVILLDDIFTAPVYYGKMVNVSEGENGSTQVFPLLKRNVDKQIYLFLKDTLEEELIINGMEVDLLSVEHNVVLCIYCDDVERPTYYLFNDGTPEKKNREDVLSKINSNIAVYEINAVYSREAEVLKVVDEIVKLL